MKENTTLIYQTKTGAIELKGDLRKETIWASLNKTQLLHFLQQFRKKVKEA